MRIWVTSLTLAILLSGGQTCFLLIRDTSLLYSIVFRAERSYWKETDNFTPVRPLGMSLALNALSPGQHLYSLVVHYSSANVVEEEEKAVKCILQNPYCLPR